MADERNSSYQVDGIWDNCAHEWEDDLSSMSGRACHCVKCGCPGDREDDDSVYWPAT